MVIRRAASRAAACLAVLALLRWAPGAVQPLPQSDGSGQDLASQIEAALADEQIRGGIQAVVVERLADGATLYERNPDTLMVPASNQKLLTTAAALHLLGPDFRYATSLMAKSSARVRSTIRGDLYLKGRGDPFLDNAGLDALVSTLRRTGVTRITGRVVGDGAYFDPPRYGYGWSWDDMSYYYSAPVSGLNFNRNVVDVSVTPGRAVGAAVTVRVSPAASLFTITNDARTGARGVGSSISVERELGRNLIVVSGHTPLNAGTQDRKPIPVTVEDPALYAATVLTEKLRKAGVFVTGAPRGGRSPASGLKEMARYEGQPLSEFIARINKPSDNLGAECLLRTIGAEKGSGGNVPEGRRIVTEWLSAIGADGSGASIRDGSGLSRMNFITANTLRRLLRAMDAHPSGEVFRSSLPIAGVDGTLRNRLKDTRAAGNCRAKTGYVSNVSSLSGYVTSKDGERLLFVILMNNHPCRNAAATAVQDRIVRALADFITGATNVSADRRDDSGAPK